MSVDQIKMFRQDANDWWASVLVGIFAILVSISCLAFPLTVVLIFSIGFITKGALEVAVAISNRKHNGSMMGIFIGIVDLAIGLILTNPLFSFSIVYLVGFWLIIQAAWSLGVSIELFNNKVPGAIWGLITAVLALIVAIIILTNQLLLAEFTAISVSFSFMLFGISRIIIGIRLKKLKDLL